MVEQISEQAYVTYMLKQQPQVERGEVYAIKDKDNLWSIAKKKLGSTKAKVSNTEIQNYMYQIAKLNKMTTIEQMNNLKVNAEIYLPKANSTHGIKQSGNRTSAEESIIKLIKQLETDKSIRIEKMPKFYESSNDLYHVYCKYNDPKSGYSTLSHPIMDFTRNRKTGKIESISFNDQQADKDPIRYDYNMNSTGDIEKNGFSLRPVKEGKINQTELTHLHKILINKISK